MHALAYIRRNVSTGTTQFMGVYIDSVEWSETNPLIALASTPAYALYSGSLTDRFSRKTYESNFHDPFTLFCSTVYLLQ